MKKQMTTENLERIIRDKTIMINSSIDSYDSLGFNYNPINYITNMTSEELNIYFKEFKEVTKEIKKDIKTLFYGITMSALIGTFISTQNPAMTHKYRVEDYIKPSITTLEKKTIEEKYI